MAARRASRMTGRGRSEPQDGPDAIFGTLVLQEPQSGEADGQWKLAEPFFYEARRCLPHCDRTACLLGKGVSEGDMCRIVIQKGTPTDLASIPRPAEWLFRRYGAYTDAAVVHDQLCDPAYPGDQRFYADWLFRNIMTRDLQVFPPRAWIMWAAVSIASFKDRRLPVLVGLSFIQCGIWALGLWLFLRHGLAGLAVVLALWPFWFWVATIIARKPGWKRAVVALPFIVTPMTPVLMLMFVIAMVLLVLRLAEMAASTWFGGRKSSSPPAPRRAPPGATRAEPPVGATLAERPVGRAEPPSGGPRAAPPPATAAEEKPPTAAETPQEKTPTGAEAPPPTPPPTPPPASPPTGEAPATEVPPSQSQPLGRPEPGGRYRIDP